MTPSERPWVLDACVTVNLAAAAIPFGKVDELMQRPVIVPLQAASEVLYLRDVEDGRVVKTKVDLDGLTIEQLRAPELEAFVAFAARLDDGEAATLAMAAGRSYVAVTDDRAARRAAAAHAPRVPVIGTATAMRYYVEANGLTESQAGRRLMAIERRARYVPRTDDVDSDWWGSCCALARAS